MYRFYLNCLGYSNIEQESGLWSLCSFLFLLSKIRAVMYTDLNSYTSSTIATSTVFFFLNCVSVHNKFSDSTKQSCTNIVFSQCTNCMWNEEFQWMINANFTLYTTWCILWSHRRDVRAITKPVIFVRIGCLSKIILNHMSEILIVILNFKFYSVLGNVAICFYYIAYCATAQTREEYVQNFIKTYQGFFLKNLSQVKIEKITCLVFGTVSKRIIDL